MHPAVSGNGTGRFRRRMCNGFCASASRALGLSVPAIDRALRGEADAVLHTAGQDRFGTKTPKR